VEGGRVVVVVIVVVVWRLRMVSSVVVLFILLFVNLSLCLDSFCSYTAPDGSFYEFTGLAKWHVFLLFFPFFYT
jgi:hypothetical protein